MNAASGRVSGPTSRSIFHLHANLVCNLACRHCYSQSSPSATALLSRAEALRAVQLASDWGYEILSISGGEPLLYPWLRDVLELARSLGMVISIISNGLLIERPGMLETLALADAVAVSVDGLAASHDAMRDRPRTFEKAKAGMAALASHNIPFAISCGVSSENLAELDELAFQVHQLGAAGLQLHPIELTGRAAANLADLVLDDEQASALYILTTLLAAEYAGRMNIRADVLHRLTVIDHPGLLYAHDDDPETWSKQKPAQLLGVLVLDPNGLLVPICYGFAAPFAIGNLRQDETDNLWARYIQQGGYARLRQLGKTAHTALVNGEGPDVFNPSDLLARLALQYQSVQP
jgi:MoaA/NifB/PqqE/SkfB family radical SAM enzyme